MHVLKTLIKILSVLLVVVALGIVVHEFIQVDIWTIVRTLIKSLIVATCALVGALVISWAWEE